MLQVKIKWSLWVLCVSACVLSGCDDDIPPSLQGKGGSLAQFALSNDHLYVVDNTSINVFQIESNGAFTSKGSVEAGVNIETIYATGSNLFLGAADAMYIFSLEDPASPEFVSSYSHITACDPVVVQDGYAYVSLRTSNCRETGSDVIDVIDIRNLRIPIRISSEPASSPYGLGVDGASLFLCEGENGLAHYDISDPSNLELVDRYTDIHAYDVITNNGVLILTGNTGVYQYQYMGTEKIQLMSHIPVAK